MPRISTQEPMIHSSGDLTKMFFRVFSASFNFAIFAWCCYYKTYHVKSAFGRAIEHPPDVVLLIGGTYFLFVALQDFGKLFVSPMFSSRVIRRYSDRFFALVLPLSFVPFVCAVCTFIYVLVDIPHTISSLDESEISIVLLGHIVPALLVCIELMVEKRISSRRLFSEAFIALLGGVGYGVWSVAFRGQAGPLSAEQYLWQLSAPLGVAFAIVQALLFVATYFVARRISQWRWRHVLEYEDLLE